MSVPTLRQLALGTAIKHVDDIEYVPIVPYEALRPILRSVKTADQLRRIESTSPHVIGEDAEIWKMLIKRDTDIDLKSIPEPKNPAKWWKVHRKLLREKEAKVENLTATLKAQMDRLKADKDSQSTTTISTLVNPFPRHRGIPASRRLQGDQSRSGAGSSGSTFLSRAREHARERATRNNASVFKTRPLVGTVPFAPKTMSDRVLGSNPKPRAGATTVQSAASGASQASSRPNQVVARPPVRVSKPLMGSRKRLASSSNVFGPNRHIY